MSPRQLDPNIVHARLATIRELLADLDSVEPATPAVLERDRMLRHAIERVLTQIVELAVSINSHVAGATLGRAPRAYKESFSLAVECGLIDRDLAEELMPSVGMRNALVHEYMEIDLEKVAAAVPLAKDGYRRYLTAVATFVTRS